MQSYLWWYRIFPDGIFTAEDRLNTCDLFWACAQRIFYKKCRNKLEHLQRLQERTLQLRSLFSFYGEDEIRSLSWTSVVDPDPAFQGNPDPDTDSGFWWPKIRKIVLDFFLNQKLQFTYPQASLKTSNLQDKPSVLKREHPALQKMKFIYFFYFCGSFCPPGSETIRIQGPH